MVKAIIMCAGLGRRLEGRFGNIPKSLIKLNDITLIEKQIAIFKKCGITEIACVVGFQKDKIIEKLGSEVIYYFNPFFDTTNSVVSLWCAKEFLKSEDTLIMNGDILAETSIIQDLIRAKSNSILVDIGKYNELGFKVKVKENQIEHMDFNLGIADNSGEYAGMVKITKDSLPKLVETLEEFLSNRQFNVWFETAIVSILQNLKMGFIDTASRIWVEIDYPDDVLKAKQYFEHE